MGQIALDSDIIEELCKRLDIDKKTAEENIDFIHKYLFEMSRDPNIGAIIIPHIGTMYFRVFSALNKIKRVGKENYWKWAGEKIEKLTNHEDWEECGFLHKKKSKLFTFSMTGGKSYKELEEHQNEDVDE